MYCRFGPAENLPYTVYDIVCVGWVFCWGVPTLL